MSAPLTRIRSGRYRHEHLGVEIEKTQMADFPWELSRSDRDGSGVVLARTLGDARAFLGEIEAGIEPEKTLSAASKARHLLLLGQAVRHEREQHGFSSEALAAASSVEQSHIEALEAGLLDASLDQLIALAEALDVSVSAFVLGAEAAEKGQVYGEAERDLLSIHRYLFPERYEDVPTHEWHAGTIEDVAAMLERSLVNDPRAELSPK